MVDLGWKMLLDDKLRFAITVAGVAFAVGLVMTQTGLFFGMLGNASVTVDRMEADIWVTSRNTPNVDFAHPYPEEYVQRVRSTPGVARADNLLVSFLEVSLPSGAVEGMLVYAMEDFAAWGFPWNVIEGDVDDLRRGPYMFLDESAAKRYGDFAIGDYREVAGKRLRIVGRTREARSFTTTPIAFMDYGIAQELRDRSGETTYTVVRLEPGAEPRAVAAELRRRLPYNDVHLASDWAAQSRDYWVGSTGIGLSMMVTVSLGLLVGIVVVAQTLYASTMEHIKEYGTVKAIGGSNGLIYRILARQAWIAAVVGFVLGALPSYAAKPLVALGDLQMRIPWTLTAVVFVGTVLMCLAAAMISFRKVASIDPALVFRG